MNLAPQGEGLIVVRLKQCMALTGLVLAGCAASPEFADESSAASVAPAATATPAAAAAESGVVTPNLVVDVRELAARAPDPVICREMLEANSNVVIRRCMTAPQWKRWLDAEAQNAAAIVRMLQGGAYR